MTGTAMRERRSEAISPAIIKIEVCSSLRKLLRNLFVQNLADGKRNDSFA